MSAETEAMWRTLGELTLAARQLKIAERQERVRVIAEKKINLIFSPFQMLCSIR